METIAPTERPIPGTPDDPVHPRVTRRLRVAEWMAFVGLIAAFLAAIGPAERVRTTYSWPPATLPEESPRRLWYTPLLLASQVPESIVANLPCTAALALRELTTPTALLSTTRFPDRTGGLLVTSTKDELTISVGARELARLKSTAAEQPGATECGYRLTVADGGWSIGGGPDNLALSGRLKALPVVTGLFSGVDVRSRPSPSVAITTKPHMTRSTSRQTIGWVVAASAILASMLLIAFRRPPRRSRLAARALVRRAAAHARVSDAVVAIDPLGLVDARPHPLGRRLGRRQTERLRRHSRLLELLRRLRDESPQRLLARVGATLAHTSLELTADPPNSSPRLLGSHLARLPVGSCPRRCRTRHGQSPCHPGSRERIPGRCPRMGNDASPRIDERTARDRRAGVRSPLRQARHGSAPCDRGRSCLSGSHRAPRRNRCDRSAACDLRSDLRVVARQLRRCDGAPHDAIRVASDPCVLGIGSPPANRGRQAIRRVWNGRLLLVRRVPAIRVAVRSRRHSNEARFSRAHGSGGIGLSSTASAQERRSPRDPDYEPRLVSRSAPLPAQQVAMALRRPHRRGRGCCRL